MTPRKPRGDALAAKRVAWLVVDRWGPVGAFKYRPDALKRATEARYRWPSAAPCEVRRILYREPVLSRPARGGRRA